MSDIKLLLALAMVALCAAGAASAQTGTAQAFPLPGDEVYPEGVAYQPATGDFFVGSTTDGAVFRGNVGEPGTEAETFLEPGADGRSTAIGMKVDSAGRLFVSGGDTGRMFVYDTETGELLDRFENGAETTFVNDVALTPDGSAFFTDSMNPELYRVFPDGSGGYSQETFLNFEGTPLEYEEGFNLNGIAATPDGRYLITVKSLSGQLFRIGTQSKEVVEIDTGGADLTNGDGLLLLGRTLYVVRNQNEVIVPVELSPDYSSGTAGEGFTDDSLMYPTTIAAYEGRLLVVNSQFDARESGTQAELPFTVSGIQISDGAAPASASTSPSASASGVASPVPDTGGVSPNTLVLVALLAGACALAIGYGAIRRLR
ncbi:superoxide dismutase [Rubrobacter tropicus]|uniref:Superoxide dismutase n=1 Tax=Rubrobacter tropicus TaxID=2653851 RepID=A0A6G8Q891_9ACTN|nr:superoxide dismutase [Rubrobacter tropicus]QIN82648.1 superoxide dismutase [Rubrobacter tropicus]